jgi:ribosome biogenesis GTPase / thiamine phosphate phosphatase
MGKLRLGVKPVVGDRVEVEFLDDKWVIQSVLERRNVLKRPLVANVDQALIVMSAKEPDFSYTLVDRLIFLVAVEGIEPIIVVNKTDLVDASFIDEVTDEYAHRGYKMVLTNRHSDAREMLTLFKDKITVLAGQSGVGKSSLMNRLDSSLKINTQEISKVLGRGKHTTRHNELFNLGEGWVADTPGFSSLDFTHISKLELAQSIPDFAKLAPCRFRNCLHQSEPGCNVKAAIERNEVSKGRYEHYLECLELTKED